MSNSRFRTNPNLTSRRTFLAGGLAGTVAAAAIPVSGDARPGDFFLRHTSTRPFELEEWTIDDLNTAMNDRRETALSLTQKYLARIEEIDRGGPNVNSVIEVNPDAEPIAAALDQERASKGPRGPLHGVPVLIKDNVATADRMKTTAGSLALVDTQPQQDSFVAKKLREAGAVILGKTNLSEWANIRCTYSTSGWSGRGGQTRNPYALDRNPCGSSSGSGAAVAANLCAVAVGTETDGSIVCPSAVCGIVGIKPTVGLVSRTGIVPISHSQDTAGPMCRTVRDAAILLGVLAGPDPSDSATVECGDKRHADYTRFLETSGLSGAKIGVARNHFDFHDGVDAVMAGVVESLRQQGATLIDTDELSIIDQVGGAETIVFEFELKSDMEAYLKWTGCDSSMKSLQDLIDFNIANRDREMPYFGQDFFEKSVKRGPLTEFAYIEALAKCRRISRTEGIDALMDKHQLDAIVAPTMGPACLTDLVNGDRWLGGSTSAAAVSGYPSITVPAGFIFGLPLGLSFFGRAWSEGQLLRIAYAFEQATSHRKPPQFLPTANLFP
jgi:amidase